MRVRTDARAALDDAVTLQDRTGQERDLGRQLDVGVDVGIGRTPHDDPAVEPAFVDPSAQHRLGAGQLHEVVDAGRFAGVLEQQCLRDVTGFVQDRDEVGQVVLVLRVVPPDTAQRRAEQARAHHHDRRVDLGDQPLVGARVALFDDPRDRAVLRVHDAPVARRVVRLGGQDGQRRLALAVRVEQSRDGARSQQRRVAGQDQDVAVARRRVSSLIVGIATETACPVPSCSLCSTNIRLTSVRARSVERLLDPRRAVSDDDDGRAHVLLGRGVEDVEHHGSSTEVVQGLGTGRPHPRAFARGEHDDTGWAAHPLIVTIFLLRFQP